MSDQELKRRYKAYGLCKECFQPKTGGDWCYSCNSKHFQSNFQNWTSGNPEIDEFIQDFQLKTNISTKAFEWISYDRLTNIEYLAEGGFGTVYKALWIDGYIKNWNW